MTHVLTSIRIAENQLRFTAAADRVAVAEGEAALPPLVPFLCECSDPNCAEFVRLSLDEYEQTRAEAIRACVVPGHRHLFA